jgi:hypothetical protein
VSGVAVRVRAVRARAKLKRALEKIYQDGPAAARPAAER